MEVLERMIFMYTALKNNHGARFMPPIPPLLVILIAVWCTRVACISLVDMIVVTKMICMNLILKQELGL